MSDADQQAWDRTVADGQSADAQVRRGDIRIVKLDPVVRSEAVRRRPAVIVSNDGANTTAVRLERGVIPVVPVTSNVQRMS